MKYRKLGNSGLKLPELSLGLWHNFGCVDDPIKARAIVLRAFESGITYFDLANNYGPPPGAAEEIFSRILKDDLASHRNSMVIASKAGHTMWQGEYGRGASRKHLIASCDESLGRLQLDYLDIFYSHCPDPETPLEETVEALDYIVRSGRALYIGLSKYPLNKLLRMAELFKELKTPFLVHQVKYSMLNRASEKELFGAHKLRGIGCVTFSPLAQGMLSEKYLNGIPSDSRAAKEHGFLQTAEVDANIEKVRSLHRIATERGESLSQMALSWQLAKGSDVTSVIMGVSSVEQLENNLKTLESAPFTADQLLAIDKITL